MNSKTHTLKPQSSPLKAVATPVALGCLLALPLNAQAVGFTQLSIADPDHKQPLELGIWYPSDAAVPSEPNTPFNQALSLDAKIDSDKHKLVLISHGFGGWMGGHADTALALAEAGFVVAAPSHTGNTFRDMSSSVEQWVINRPHQISTTIDYLQQTWDKRDSLSGAQVGVYGFSAGGLTALSLIGAVPNMQQAQQHCESTPGEYGCRDDTLVPALIAADMHELSDADWGADDRIGAAAMAAPGLAFAYAAETLKAVKTPVQLWSALLDDRVPHETNSLPLSQSLSTVETHWIEKAGHFAFMVQPCTQKLKKVEPDTWDFLCIDKEGFDRRAFHTEMNAELVQFFEHNL